jgi:hypothetical protein
MNATIVDAIQTKKVLSLTYNGVARTVQPHAYGMNHLGHELLRAYQVSGGHQKAGHVWDLFTVSKIVGLSVTGDTFQSAAPLYARGDKAMSTIYAEL